MASETDAHLAQPIIAPGELHAAMQLTQRRLRIVDLSRPEAFAQGHVPGAAHLDYARVIRKVPPSGGLVPEPEALYTLLRDLGIDAHTHVVAYDGEGGAKASRLLWTLNAFGHRQGSLLDGGIAHWNAEGLPLELEPAALTSAPDYRPAYTGAGVDDYASIAARLGSDELCLVDARSPGEFRGEDVRARRGGHIPGAVNVEWTELLILSPYRRLRPWSELAERFAAAGVRQHQHVVCYCQTHHRSALTWLVLVAMGYPRVSGYPGSWSDWGNREDAPIEVP